MQIEMRYGHGTVPLEIPDKNLVAVLETDTQRSVS